MKVIISIFSGVFFLAMSFVIALADVVPGAVIYLDARDNPAHPDAWTNLGTAGGELLANDTTPELEEGDIEIPALDFVLDNAKFYTAVESRQTFGGPVGANPEVFVENWTLEFLCKRNGDLFQQEHQFAGFHNTSSTLQGTYLRLQNNNAEAWVTHPEPGAEWWTGIRHYGIMLELGEWTWVTITGNEDEFVVYQNGDEVGKDSGLTFDDSVIMDDICVGSGMYGERHRNFNGSFAIVRIYDKALSADEINGNIQGNVAVDPAAKLATAWGREKTRY